MFEHFQYSCGDPILSLQESFAADGRQDKVNLSIGLYYDSLGRIPDLEAVRIARERVSSTYSIGGYLPMAGAPAYRLAVKDLLFGSGLTAAMGNRIACIQSLGSSGALKTGADLLKGHFPDSQIWISDPSWENHAAIFEGAGFVVNRYPYYDAASASLDFDGMRRRLSSLRPQSIVLLQPSCHNPTGLDPTPEQWDEVIQILCARKLIAFFDLAYQGYGEDVKEDAYPIRELARAGGSFLVANSFSKIFSLYKERCGALCVVCTDPNEASRVLGQMEKVVRRTYSSPPCFGSEMVTLTLGDSTLRKLWIDEVRGMRDRIREMRRALRASLEKNLPGFSFGHITQARGMFSYTGLAPKAVVRLRAEHGVYLVGAGRLCMTGVNEGNVERIGRAIAAVLQTDCD